ncbi:MAG: LicD family protein [Muribaculaceae bacterium]|nr:LicD family protein [Muribaculaceae bacterium]
MEELSLHEIQKYCLDVLLHIHDFCMAQNIPYTLAYGTLIGAVRHNGFIPWDDDIDIIMTRDNFERFMVEYKPSEGFMLVAPEDKKSYIAFARMCDCKYTVAACRTPWSGYTTGVWVDIFPMDSIDDDENSHKYRYEIIHERWAKLAIPRGAKSSLSMQWGVKDNFKILIKKLISFNGMGLRNKVESFMCMIHDNNYDDSYHCAQLACCDEYGFYEKKDFEEYTSLEFEGHQLCVIRQYDKFLRMLYGNYMQLPPEEMQQPKQYGSVRFYHK